jgi:hypothetical protein
MMPEERPMAHTPGDQSPLLAPVFLTAAILLAAFPVMHPYGTCHDWLVEWGEASLLPYWGLIHKMAMAGFALIAGIGAVYALVTPRTWTSVFGGACLVGGGGISAISILIHATAISSLGRAFSASGSAAEQKLIKIVAEAFVEYDMAAVSTCSMLITAGLCLITVSLYQRRVLSLVPAGMFFGLSLVWTFQYHKVFNMMGFSIPETVHWSSLCLVLAGLGSVLYLRGRVTVEKPAAAPLLVPPQIPSEASITD